MTGRKTVAEVWALQARHKAFAARVYDAWRALGLDAVLCPAGVMPATKNGAAAVADRSIDSSLSLSPRRRMAVTLLRATRRGPADGDVSSRNATERHVAYHV